MSTNNQSGTKLRAVLLSVLLIVSAGGSAVGIAAASHQGGEADHVATSPTSVGVTAGAFDQAPFDESGGSTLNFTEENASAFPSGVGVANLTLPADAGVRFDETNSSVRASGSNVTASAELVDDRTVEITVTGVEDSEVESLSIDGLRFVVQPDAENAAATWEFGGVTATTDVEPERLNLDLWGTTTFARGAANQPDNGVRLTISGSDERSTGFHEEGERIVVRIPVEHRDVLSFNTDSDTTITTGQGACEPDLIENYDRSLSNYTFSFVAHCDLGGNRGYTVDDLFFDSPGANLSEPTEEEVRLELDAAPLKRVDRVNTSANDSIHVVAPDVDVDGNVTTLAPGDESDTGNESIRVDVTDPHGGLIADGSTIEISFEETGTVGFDPDQTLVVNQTNASQNFDASVAEVTADHVVLNVNGESGAGEGITLTGENGSGVLFDVLDAEDFSTNLTVTTRPPESGTLGDSVGQDVLQRTDGGVRVDSGSTADVSLANDAPTWLERGADRSTGNESVVLELTDPDGEAIQNDSTVRVALPADAGVAFDESQGDDLVVDADGSLEAEVTDVSAGNVTLRVVGNSAAMDSITLRRADGDGLLFNVSDSATTGPVSLDVTTTNDVGVETTQSIDPALRVVEPTADVALENGGPTTVEAGTNQTAGDTPIVLNVSDDVGGAVVGGSTIEVAFDADRGVTFDESQTLVVEQPEAVQQFDAEVHAVRPDAVVLNVTTGSDGGESIRLVRDGNATGIRFNVTENAGGASVSFSVTTDNGERATAQSTDETVTVPGSNDDGGNTGGGGGGSSGGGGAASGGGGGSSSPSPSFNVTGVSLSATEVAEGETVEVTVTVANEGDADGSYDVRVKANAFTVATETVDVAAGETVEVSVPVRFLHVGERKITVDGVEAGSVAVRELEPDSVPESAVAADARPVVDADGATNGTVVEFDGNVTVDSITFPRGADGTATVADLEALPGTVDESPGTLLRAMEIVVPAELEDESATVRLAVDESTIDVDPGRVRLARYHDGDWQVLEPRTVASDGGTVVYEFETPGFSTFALFVQEPADPEPTATAESTPADTDSTPTETDADSGAEEAGFRALGVLAVLLLGGVALAIAVVGARIHRQTKS